MMFQNYDSQKQIAGSYTKHDATTKHYRKLMAFDQANGLSGPTRRLISGN